MLKIIATRWHHLSALFSHLSENSVVGTLVKCAAKTVVVGTVHGSIRSCGEGVVRTAEVSLQLWCVLTTWVQGREKSRQLRFSRLSLSLLTIFISAGWSATTFSFLAGQVSLPCNMLLHTQLLYNLPVIINDTSLLVSSGTNCLNLFQPIRLLAYTAASASPFTLSMSPR